MIEEQLETKTIASSRIPPALQEVFLTSNRGDEVSLPLANGVASRLFRRVRNTIEKGKRVSRQGDISDCVLGEQKHHRLDRSISSRSLTTSLKFKANVAKHEKVVTHNSVHLLKLQEDGHNVSENVMKSLHRLHHKSIVEAKASLISPHAYFETKIAQRGYPTTIYDARNSGYYNNSTPLQEASYTLHIVELVKDGKRKQLRKIIECGIHPNPGNCYGESLIHLVCRLGSYETLHVMLECGSSVQCCDDHGRTPLHDACWASQPSFDLITLLIQEDYNLLFMADSRGSTPLQYISKQNWDAWRNYIDMMIDNVFPVRARSKQFLKKIEDASLLARLRPNSQPLYCPTHILDMHLIKILANGRMTPDEIDVIRGSNNCGNFSIDFDSSEADEEDSEQSEIEKSNDSDDTSDIYFDKADDVEEDDGDDMNSSASECDSSDSNKSECDVADKDVYLRPNSSDCDDYSVTSFSRIDKMYLHEEDFEEMMQRIAMSKKTAKESGQPNLKHYYYKNRQ